MYFFIYKYKESIEIHIFSQNKKLLFFISYRNKQRKLVNYHFWFGLEPILNSLTGSEPSKHCILI